jgi:hypothetical protein
MAKKRKAIKSNTFMRFSHVFPFVALIIFVLIIYSNSFDCSFQFDDETSIWNNKKVKSLSNFVSFDTWTNINERPLSYVTLAFNYYLGGLNPTGYHWFNVLAHILAAILVFLLSKLLIGISLKELPEKKKIYVALGAALIFAAHPIQVMSVIYIVQRMSILSGLFYILSVLLYIKARQYHINKGLVSKTTLLYFATGLAGILALLSKQNAATLPIMWWFVELYFIRNKDQKAAKKYLVVFGSIILVGIVSVVITGILPRETEDISRWQYLISQFKILVLYFQLILFPVALNINHNIPVSGSLFGIYEIIGLVLIIFLVFMAIRFYKKQRLLSFGIIWFFVNMSIESSIIPITDLMMEHRIYLPIYGIALVVAYGLFLLLKQNIVRYSLVMILIIIILGTVTYQRNFDWKSVRSIWTSSLQVTPDNPRSLVYVGLSYAKVDQRVALKYYNQALKVDSGYYHAWLSRGMVYYKQNKYQQAIYNFNKALDITERQKYIFLLRGISYLQTKQYKPALIDLNRYIKKYDNNPKAYIYRGEVNYNLKNYSDAGEDFLNALELNPNIPELYVNLIEVFYRTKDTEKGRHYIKIAQKNGFTVNPIYLDFFDMRPK